MDIYDLIIIGGGPAGLTAGIYSARGGLKTLLLEGLVPGGQMLKTDQIENYPGFPEGIKGATLTEKFFSQAKKFGLSFDYYAAQSIKPLEKGDLLVQCQDQDFHSKTVIICAGASPVKLNIPGEDTFLGRGVSYCAICDGGFFKEKVVAVVGGGDSAVQESIYLSRLSEKVYLIHRRDQLRAKGVLCEAVTNTENIQIFWNCIVKELFGQDLLEEILVENLKENKIFKLAIDGFFVYIGFKPNTDFIKDLLDVDEGGFIIVDLDMKTSVEGIWAIGDIRSGSVRQIAAAVGDAAVAAINAQEYIASLPKIYAQWSPVKN